MVLTEIAAGLATAAGLDIATGDRPILTLDEIHKFVRWKNFIKGFFDIYEDRMRLIVTGSARLDIYKRGGDSLMGRYFLYHMHPFGVAEGVRYENHAGARHHAEGDWGRARLPGRPRPAIRRR